MTEATSQQGPRFADIQLLSYEVPGFDKLSLRQKLFVYYLAEAALLGRDILWDQNCRYGLQLRRVLEAIYTHYDGPKDTPDWLAFNVYMKRVWFSNGIHHHYSCLKFQPEFSKEFFLKRLKALESGQDSPLSAVFCQLSKEEIVDLIFNPEVMPKRVNHADGEDLLLTSSCNYYAEGITQAEAEAFYADLKKKADPQRPPMIGLNSRLERGKDGSLYENVWRVGSLYGKAIERICEMLGKAREYEENDKQKAVIDKLIEFYKSGDLKTFDEYAILWVSET